MSSTSKTLIKEIFDKLNTLPKASESLPFQVDMVDDSYLKEVERPRLSKKEMKAPGAGDPIQGLTVLWRDAGCDYIELIPLFEKLLEIRKEERSKVQKDTGEISEYVYQMF